MSDTKKKKRAAWESVCADIGKTLGSLGVDLDLDAIVDCCRAGDEDGQPRKVKVVCVAPGLKDALDEMGERTRDQVVMVRVDDETSQALDAWVETDAVKSRSEAAALFIREGLKVRARELENLNEALADVERARQRLRDRAREVFGAGKDEG